MLREVGNQDAQDQKASKSNSEGIWRSEGSAVPGGVGGGHRTRRVDMMTGRIYWLWWCWCVEMLEEGNEKVV